MEFYAITSTWVCVCGEGTQQRAEASQDRWPGDWEHRSQTGRERQGRPHPTCLPARPLRGPDLVGAQGRWPMGAWPPAHSLGLACTPRGAQKQERPPTRRGGVSSGAPAQSKVRDSGGVPHPPACSESSRSEIGCWQGCIPLRLLLLSAPLVPSACGPVTAACDSDSVVPWGRRGGGAWCAGLSGGATALGPHDAPPRSPGAAGVPVRRLRTDTPNRFMGHHV